ncbi:hypothetical protein A4U88_2305 [Serratia marcescens]|nr:hypothetical protein A4U88_2305 [Serratia marcescens]
MVLQRKYAADLGTDACAKQDQHEMPPKAMILSRRKANK